MLLVAALISSFLIHQFIVVIIRINHYWKSYGNIQKMKEFPKVSVLVAARNEEQHLPQLLASFDLLDYPKDQVEFLFADDQSIDQTPQLLDSWCQKKKNANYLSVQEVKSTEKNPKAFALGLLAKKAQGDYFLFTDADCKVNPQWIKGMISSFQEKTGIALGITQVAGAGISSFFQEIDWWNTQGFVKVASDIKLSTTGLGNNMAIKASAYRESGGFLEIPFSLTEDLEISKAVSKLGYEVISEVSPNTLAFTKAESSLVTLLAQRKRWMFGVMTLPWFWKVILGLQFFYFPAIIFLYSSIGWWILLVAGTKSFFQALFHYTFAKKAGRKLSFWKLLSFDFYFFPISLLTILYYFWPSPVKWKSRKYR
ncbi:MAG TPA: glycosyl transferase [Algoriphagus sp.]|jgi:cellulose synthase/poly-beta-1,6-N-acetylglucosamine synthase-like glycosyltransferase|uniref:glycosyltransferase n=1 Tax=unclassified Algoriphagus TaxID=2641541 RepID=UPI000C61182F|nr:MULTISPECIES: glycosyltransferase [unclassified Algoriphagus]MAL15090.1 glycosyl transferase [Algoriphagus sp.]HCD89568.1 glycosyl transferase [Algoriphagus sp.]HCH45037.1 glycosyl transferase [Algoriphagus sp.]|tara:strand:- start:6253 stop:7356 length:1104 start_codon:yes stop_codon:yes gene_type:complete